MESGPDFFLEVLCLALYSNDTETERILKSVIDTYHDEVNNGSPLNDTSTDFYIRIVTEILNQGIDINNPNDLETLLIKFEHHQVIKSSPKILSRIETLIRNRQSVGIDKVRSLKLKIRKWLVWVQGNRNLKRLFKTSQRVVATNDTILQDTLMNELRERAKDLSKTYDDAPFVEDSAIDFIDMGCTHSIKRGFESYKNKRIIQGFKMGLQGLNRMFGQSCGPVPGEYGAFAALSYHYKSGMLMDIARWMAQYNKPRPIDGRQDAILFISLENEIFENMMMWFRSAYRNYYKAEPDGISDNEIIEKTQELYNKCGFKLLVFRREGDLFGYEEWRSLHEEQSEKYHIVCSITDYVGLMRKDESAANAAKAIQELHCKLKNYANRHNMLTITGVQLDGEAEKLSASGVTNIVKKYGAGHLADCKGQKREFDWLIFLHIEKNHLDQSYLTMCLNKHKYVTTDASAKYCAYLLPDDGSGIPDDVDSECKAVQDIYSVNSSSGQNDNKSLF